jgi:hypothetical protein
MSSESLALIQRSCPLIEELNLGVPGEEPEVRLLICHPLNRGLITNFKQHQKFCEVIRQFPMLRDLELRTHNTRKYQEWERDQGRDPDKRFAMKTNTYLNPPGVESRLFKLAVRVMQRLFLENKDAYIELPRGKVAEHIQNILV